MRRFAGMLLIMVLVLSFSVAIAQKAECPVGGFSVELPDHFVEEPQYYDSELCFFWHGEKLTVLAYASYQGEVDEIPEVFTGNETETGYKSVNGMRMFYTRSEAGGKIDITYTWMDRGNSVTMEFTYSADDPSVQRTVDSVISSIRFDAGH